MFININLLQSVYDKTQTVFNRGHIDSLLYLSESVFTDLKTFNLVNYRLQTEKCSLFDVSVNVGAVYYRARCVSESAYD